MTFYKKSIVYTTILLSTLSQVKMYKVFIRKIVILRVIAEKVIKSIRT